MNGILFSPHFSRFVPYCLGNRSLCAIAFLSADRGLLCVSVLIRAGITLTFIMSSLALPLLRSAEIYIFFKGDRVAVNTVNSPCPPVLRPC